MNLFRQFTRLLPQTPLLVGQVTAHNADGTSDIELPGAITIRARGQAVAIGNKAFVQGGEVKSQAPNLATSTVEV